MAIRTKWRGCFLELVDGQLSDEQLQSLYERSINGTKEQIDDLIVQLVPAANRVVGRYKRYFGLIAMEDMASIAYAALPGALKSFDPNRGKGKLWHFAYVHVSGMVWSAIRTARRKKRIMPNCIEPSERFDLLQTIPDTHRGPAETAEVNDEVGMIFSLIEKQSEDGSDRWEYLLRNFGVGGHFQQEQRHIASDLGVHKSWVSFCVQKAIRKLREELNVA